MRWRLLAASMPAWATVLSSSRKCRMAMRSAQGGGPQVTVGRHSRKRRSQLRRPQGQLSGGQLAERRGDSAVTGPDCAAAPEAHSVLCAFCRR